MSRILPAVGLAFITGHFTAAVAQPGLAARAPASAASAAYPSALDTYRPYAEQPVGPWKQANEKVREIGGWRTYAREAQGAPSAAPPASLPASSASSPHAGHH